MVQLVHKGGQLCSGPSISDKKCQSLYRGQVIQKYPEVKVDLV